MTDETTEPQTAEVAAAPDADTLVQDFKKDELVAAAQVQNVEVKSADTKADIAAKIVDATPSRNPVRVDQLSRRSDADAIEGSFVRVLSGKHAGQIASFLKTLEHEADGYPKRILLRFKDTTHTHEHAAEDYSNVRMVNHPGFPRIDQHPEPADG